MMWKVEAAVQHIPVPVQVGLNYGSVGAALSAFFGAIQGPLAVIASVLSIIWLGMQIWLFLKNKPWRRNN